MEKRNKALISLFMLLTAITILSGCTEGGEFHESYALHKGEERQITGTNYSLLLRSSEYYDQTAFIEIYQDSEYLTEKILSHDNNIRMRIGDNIKIVLDEVLKSDSVRISIYFV